MAINATSNFQSKVLLEFFWLLDLLKFKGRISLIEKSFIFIFLKDLSLLKSFAVNCAKNTGVKRIDRAMVTARKRSKKKGFPRIERNLKKKALNLEAAGVMALNFLPTLRQF